METSIAVETFLTTLKAVVTVGIVYSTGFLIVYAKVIDREGVKTLSSLAKTIFLPALFFVRFGAGLNVETVKHAWRLPIVGVALLGYYFVIAKYVMVPLGQPEEDFRKFFILGQTFTNIVDLPLVLLASICSQVEVPRPNYMLEKLYEDGTDGPGNVTELLVLTQAECSATADLYIFMNGLLVSFAVWIFAFEYVHKPEDTEKDVEKNPEVEDDATNTSSTEAGTTTDASSHVSAKKTRALTGQPWQLLSIALAKGKTTLKSLGKQMLMPINLSQLLGIAVGLIAPVQNVLFEDSGWLKPVSAGLDIIAAGALSALNIIMSCALAFKLQTVSFSSASCGKSTKSMEQPSKTTVSKRTLFVYATGRMILIPAVSLLLFRIVDVYVFELTPADDKLMGLIIYVQLFMPTANIVVLLSQLANQPENAETVALAGLFQYLIGLVSITGFTFLTLLILEMIE